jgi:hypothetical protein
MGGGLEHMREMNDAIKIFVRKLRRKRFLARHQWEENIKMHVKERVCKGTGGIKLAQDRILLAGSH